MRPLETIVQYRTEGMDDGNRQAVLQMVDQGGVTMMIGDDLVTFSVFDKGILLSRGEASDFLGLVTYVNGKSLGYVHPPFDTSGDDGAPDWVTRTSMQTAANIFPLVMLSISDALAEGVDCVAMDENALYKDTATCNRMWLLLNQAFPQLGGYIPEMYREPDTDEILRRHLEQEADRIMSEKESAGIDGPAAP